MKLAGFLEEIGEQRIYDTVRIAFDAATAADTATRSRIEWGLNDLFVQLIS